MENSLTFRLINNLHFYHFFLGSFIPILHIIINLKPSQVILITPQGLDHPFVHFFYDLELPNLEIVVRQQAQRKDKIYKYQRLDEHSLFPLRPNEKKKIKQTVEFLKEKCLEYINRQGGSDIEKNYDVIIQERKSNLELENYYKTLKGGHVNVYGGTRRKVEDFDKLADLLSSKYGIKCHLEFNDGAHLFKQMYPYLNVKNMIFGHGAGMIWSLFLSDGAKIIEIATPGKKHNIGPKLVNCVYRFKRLLLVSENFASVLHIKNIENKIKNHFDLDIRNLEIKDNSIN